MGEETREEEEKESKPRKGDELGGKTTTTTTTTSMAAVMASPQSEDRGDLDAMEEPFESRNAGLTGEPASH